MKIIVFMVTALVLAAQEPATVIGFEPGEPTKYLVFGNAKMTTESPIAGTTSLMWDGRETKTEWNEFFRTDLKKFTFNANGTYTVSVSYTIVEQSTDKSFLYIFARSMTGGVNKADKGWTQIAAGSGTSGKKTLSFTLGDFPDYTLGIGYRHAGKVIIDNVTISAGAPEGAH